MTLPSPLGSPDLGRSRAPRRSSSPRPCTGRFAAGKGDAPAESAPPERRWGDTGTHHKGDEDQSLPASWYLTLSRHSISPLMMERVHLRACACAACLALRVPQSDTWDTTHAQWDTSGVRNDTLTLGSPASKAYVVAVTARLREILGDALIGVYLQGCLDGGSDGGAR